MAPGSERHLAAIMFTDIVGYTALMAESEEKGLRARERGSRCTRGRSRHPPGSRVRSSGSSWPIPLLGVPTLHSTARTG